MKKAAFLLVLFFLISCAYAWAADWSDIEGVMGKKGTVYGDVLKYTFPRGDLKVKVGKAPVYPGLALTTWVTFHREGDQAAIMGDLVLTEGDVAPAMAKLESEGIWVTALHNHLLGETPRVMYMHFGGRGEPKAVAGAVKEVLKLTGTPLVSIKRMKPSPAGTWSRVESILGKTGQEENGVIHFSFPRAEPVTEMGVEIPPVLGVATSVNMEMAGKKAAAAGDFVLTAEEVNEVVNALIGHGIAVTGIHNHMLFESPRLFFLHFWGYDEPGKLAEGIKAALEKVNIKRE